MKRNKNFINSEKYNREMNINISTRIPTTRTVLLKQQLSEYRISSAIQASRVSLASSNDNKPSHVPLYCET